MRLRVGAPRQVVQIQVKFGTLIVGQIDGQELRNVTGIAFGVPARGMYNLTVAAKDLAGCITSTTASRPVTVF